MNKFVTILGMCLLGYGLFAGNIPGANVDVDNVVRKDDKVEVKDTERLIANVDACEIEGKADSIAESVAPIERAPEAGKYFIIVCVHLEAKKKGLTPNISRYDYVLVSDDDDQEVYSCIGISAKSRSMVFETRPCPPVYGDDLDVYLLFEVPEKKKEFLFTTRPVEGGIELPLEKLKINLNSQE